MSEGKLVVISGPSGVGKGTIVHRLLSMDNNLVLSTSATTRRIRPGETNGKEYYFITKNTFLEYIEQNKLAEYTNYAGNYYGTLKSTINDVINAGKTLILEIEVNGALQIKNLYPNATLIFIMPPSISELKIRLQKRNTESNDAIKIRLSQVDRELSQAKKFAHHIVNDDLEIATLAVLEAIYSENE